MFKKLFFALIFVTCFTPSLVFAQTNTQSEIDALREVISSLLLQIESLKKEVVNLKSIKEDTKEAFEEVIQAEKAKEKRKLEKKIRDEKRKEEKIKKAEPIKKEIENICHSARPIGNLAKSVIESKCRRLQNEYKDKTGIRLDIKPKSNSTEDSKKKKNGSVSA